MPEAGGKLRILALHSWRTSGSIFIEQMRRAGLDKALADMVEITYVDAPNDASGPPPEDVKPFFQGPYKEWWSAQQDEERQRIVYMGWDRTAAYLGKKIKELGPFNGIMGFSQGAACASTVVALQRQGRMLQDEPQFKFCIFFAGALNRDVHLRHIYEQHIDTPSIHIIGEKVAKKAFEAVARKSVSNISVLITDSFQGDKEVLRLRDSLEMKLKVVSLPIDLCVRQAVRGNTALQGALDLALKVLQDIETFEQALQRQAIGAARGDRTTPERAASTARQLEGLLRQLDGLLPYLGVTISSGLLEVRNSVGLVGADERGVRNPSLDVYQGTPLHAPASCTNPGAAVITLGSAAWLKQGLTATKVPVRPMKTEFMLASVSLQRSCSSDEADSGAEAQALPGAWEVAVKQVLDDGTYHEDDEVAGSHTLQMQDIIGLDWATSQSLGLGNSDMQPALVIFAVKAGEIALYATLGSCRVLKLHHRGKRRVHPCSAQQQRSLAQQRPSRQQRK
eukprot:jgi/Astpho2/7178/fgenesh1_pg.00113_%23_20_t